MHRFLMPFRVAFWSFRNWENLAEVRHAMRREGFPEPQALATFRWFYGRKFHGYPL